MLAGGHASSLATASLPPLKYNGTVKASLGRMSEGGRPHTCGGDTAALGRDDQLVIGVVKHHLGVGGGAFGRRRLLLLLGGGRLGHAASGHWRGGRRRGRRRGTSCRACGRATSRGLRACRLPEEAPAHVAQARCVLSATAWASTALAGRSCAREERFGSALGRTGCRVCRRSTCCRSAHGSLTAQCCSAVTAGRGDEGRKVWAVLTRHSGRPSPRHAAMETTPYIGASISLVSKAGIRYEGTLFTIDTQQSNLALQNGACTPPVPRARPRLKLCCRALACAAGEEAWREASVVSPP